MRKVPIDAALAFSPCNKAVNCLSDGGYAIVEYLSESCLYSISVFAHNFIAMEENAHIQASELYDIIDRQDTAWTPLTQDMVLALLSGNTNVSVDIPAKSVDRQRVTEVLANYRDIIS